MAFFEAKLVSFSGAGFLSRGVRTRFSFYSMKGIFLMIKGSKILLDQEDQLLIGLIKILQASNGQNHLIVQIEVVL